jgi:hypothetical protein
MAFLAKVESFMSYWSFLKGEKTIGIRHCERSEATQES